MKKIILLVCLSVLLPQLSWAQASRSVPVDDPVYHFIDKLIAHGLVKDAIIGQRPWSRMEVARLLIEAETHLSSFCRTPDFDEVRCQTLQDYLERLMRPYQNVFKDEISYLKKGSYSKNTQVSWLDQVSLGFTYLDSPPRRVLSNSSRSRIDALTNPLVENREGEHTVDGTQYAWETNHWVRFTPYFVFDINPRFEALFPQNGHGPDDTNLLLQHLYGKITYADVELEVGRDSLNWGQAEEGGTLISNNARPLDMIKLSNDHPYRFPWIFKYLGNFKGTFFLANLGPEQHFQNSFFTGLKVSLQPVSFIEFGFSQGLIMGGDGSPELDAGDVLSEFFASRGGNFLSTAGIQEQNLSNRIYGGEIRITIPPLRNSVFYLEMNSDDAFFSRFKTNWGYLAGIYIPRLGDFGRTDLRIEFKNFPSIFYGHGTFTSGWALNDQIMGDPLGPDGTSLMAKLSFQYSERFRFSLKQSYSVVDSDVYNSPGNSAEFVVVTDKPTEKRLTSLLSTDYQLNRRLRLINNFGYEHVTRFNFKTGRNLENFLFDARLVFDVGNPKN